ncbi:MAG: hypothetical protein HY782_28440 [Chloroflexi bacterium]|nr:hypothetical protein [Chloroflexota bacterium]
MKTFVITGLVLVALAASACSAVPGLVPPTPTAVPTAIPTRVPPTNTPAATNTAPRPTTAPAVLPTAGNAVDALSKVFKSWTSVKSFRAKMTIIGQPTGTTEMNLEVVTPDRFHMTSKQMEIVLIGNTVYLKLGNTWQKVPLPQGIDLSLADPKKYADEIAASTDVKLVGVETLDGTPTIIYQYTVNIKGPPAQKITSKVWVGATDNLPRKVESAPTATQKTTILFTDYNANITINPPIP